MHLLPRSVARTLGAIAVVVGLGACSDDEGTSPGDAGPADAVSTLDGGDAGGPPVCDSSFEPGEFVIACNPVDGTRCEVSSGTRCVLDLQTDEGECVCLNDVRGFQQPCEPGALQCAPGFACFALNVPGSPEGPVCQKICAFETGRGCEGIDESGVEAFECAGLNSPSNPQVAAEFGVCVFVGESCDLIANDCDDNQTCTITGLQTACVDVGNQELGDPCGLEARCERDLVCVQGRLDLRPVCNRVCDPEAEEDPCPTGQRCTAFRDLPGGICSG